MLKFNTETDIPAGAHIRSAVLTLTVKGGDAETRRIGAFRLPDSFDAPVTTWLRRKTGIAWRAAGGDFQQLYAEGFVSGAVGSHLTLDVTPLVQEAVDGRFGASRWSRVELIDLSPPSAAVYREYFPSEISDPRVRPTLLVVWEDRNGTASASAPLPPGWSATDIGPTGAPGRGQFIANSFVSEGAGLDIWGVADQFNFIHRTLTGDGAIVAQVSTLEGVNAWTKAGVMMRETLAAGSKHAFMLVSASKGLAFQRRPSTGGLSVNTAGCTGTSPYYVKMARQGDTFTASKSIDGVVWTIVGTEEIKMTPTIYVGLAVGSHVTGVLATASFDGVAVRQMVEQPPSEQSAHSEKSASLRLLHWNVRHGGTRSDGRYDPENTVNWILSMKPDVATLVEFDNSTQVKRILDLLRAKTGITWASEFDGRGNLIVSRLPVIDKDLCLVNSSVGRKSAFMTVLQNGRTVSIYASQLALTNSERAVDVAGLRACAANKVENRILSGDYNMQSTSTTYTTMMNGHTDAWKVAKGLGTAKNYSGNCDGCTKNSRIDYVFTSTGATQIAVKSAEIVDTRNSSGVMASDHKPMVVVYEVK